MGRGREGEREKEKEKVGNERYSDGKREVVRERQKREEERDRATEGGDRKKLESFTKQFIFVQILFIFFFIYNRNAQKRKIQQKKMEKIKGRKNQIKGKLNMTDLQKYNQ